MKEGGGGGRPMLFAQFETIWQCYLLPRFSRIIANKATCGTGEPFEVGSIDGAEADGDKCGGIFRANMTEQKLFKASSRFGVYPKLLTRPIRKAFGSRSRVSRDWFPVKPESNQRLKKERLTSKVKIDMSEFDTITVYTRRGFTHKRSEN